MTLRDAIAAEAGPAFLSSHEFGEVGTYTPAGGGARRVVGVFDRIAELADIGEMIQMDGVAATFTVETAKVPELALHDTIEVRGQLYRVLGNEPDGTGHTRIVLGI